MKCITLSLLIIFISFSSFASDFEMKCVRTPELLNRENLPEKFLKSNNLEKSHESFNTVEGIHVLVYGKVFDQHCIPVQNAIISLWQPSNDGVYDKSGDTWSGVASTDNLGRYEFRTVKFPLKGTVVPFVNMTIEHVEFVKFETTMFFGDEQNFRDTRFSMKLNKSEQPYVIARYEGFSNGVHVYTYNVIIGGYHRFKQN